MVTMETKTYTRLLFERNIGRGGSKNSDWQGGGANLCGTYGVLGAYLLLHLGCFFFGGGDQGGLGGKAPLPLPFLQPGNNGSL